MHEYTVTIKNKIFFLGDYQLIISIEENTIIKIIVMQYVCKMTDHNTINFAMLSYY